jgi:dephospho-CoA kinase
VPRQVIGLTGGMGTGKSRVLETLVSLGAHGVDADRVSHEVMLPGGPAFEPVVAAFGREMLTAAGEIDRSRLGRRVFADPAALARLESIVHPAVHEAIKRRLAASSAPVFVIEAIKLLEAGLSRALCDVVWVTHCSFRSQLARLKASRGMSAAEVRRRLANQMSPAEMVRQADLVINTEGTYAETDLAVLAGWADLDVPFPPPEYAVATADDAEGVAAVLNSVVREGGQTVIDRTFTPAQERRFIRSLPPRSRLTVARLGRVAAGFQVMEPYADYTGAMDHVAGLGTYVAAPARGRGIGQGLMAQTCAAARQMGYRKFVIMVRADNAGAQAFYERAGFRACGRLTAQAHLDGYDVDEIIYELFL